MPVVRINAEKDARCRQSVVQLQGDTRTTMVRFIVNRYDGGVDLAGLVWLIKTTNAAGVPDAWEPEMVENAGEKIVIDWLIQGNVNYADGLTEYELNGLGYEADGKAIKWVGGKGTVSVRKSYHPTFGDDADGFSNLEKLIIYVNGELQDTVAAVERAEAAATAAAAASADSIWTSKPQGLSFGQQLQAQENIGLLEVVKNLTNPVEAEGNPVQAALVGGLPFDKLATVLEPVQAGSGDPYPAGGGPNLLPYVPETTMNGATIKTAEDGGVYISGTPTANTFFNIDCNIALNGTYVFSMGNKEAIGDHLQMRLLDESGNQGNTNVTAANADAYIIYPTAKTIKKFVIRLGAGVAYNVTIYPQLIAGTEKVEFHPYENIRSISGWTGAKLTRCGKNLCNEALVQGTRGTTGILSAGTTYICVTNESLIPVVPGMVVYVNTSKGAFNGAFRHYLYDADMQLISTVGGVAYNAAVAIPEGVAYFAIQYAGTDYADYIGTYLMVSNGEFAAYEPYQGNAYAADFGQTVYGGTLDWQTGVLTVGWRIARLTSNGNWVKSGTALNGYYLTDSALFPNKLAFAPVVCNIARYVSDIDEYKTNYGTIYADNTISMNITPSACGSTLESFKAWLDANDVQIAYKLENPTTIQLTPQEIAQLEGINTLYGDGSIAIIGRQKPDLALVSRIEALESAILNA